MKLQNKKTGGLANIDELCVHTDAGWHDYSSLTELNEEWEDYEEPEEEFWYIDSDCETYGVSRAFNQNDSDDVLFNKSIGNYFETKEEAERAVEKLKAWKRLKDNGFRFESMDCLHYSIYYDEGKSYETHEQCERAMLDLELLFGGEE